MNETIKMRVECYQCDTVYVFEVPAEGYLKWQDGMSIQDAMPDISKEDKALLTTEICEPCWHAMKEFKPLPRVGV
jgi:hypothetical protein